MKVGSLGDIVFEVSDRKIRTIQSATLSGSANISEHKRNGRTSLAEHTGTSLEKIVLSVKISAYLGFNPTESIDTIRTYMEAGAALTLTLGTKRYGRGKWLIASFIAKLERYDKFGNLTEADVTLNLTEYQ